MNVHTVYTLTGAHLCQPYVIIVIIGFTTEFSTSRNSVVVLVRNF